MSIIAIEYLGNR